LNKTQTSLLFGTLMAIICLSLITYEYPSLDDLWVENPFWNGLSTFYKVYEPIRLSEVSDLENIVEPSNTTLFIIGPSSEFDVEEIRSIKIYLLQGGRLVLADDFGTGNQLLNGLELNARFDGGLLEDPLFRERNSLLPVVKTEYGRDPIVLNYATGLLGVEDNLVRAWSSPFSFLINDDASKGISAHPIIAEIALGAGKIILVSDSSIFINSMISMGGNNAIIKSLNMGDALIDEAHSVPSRLSYFKGLLEKTYTLFGSLELRYSFAIAAVALICLVKYDTEDGHLDEVEVIINSHPEYDKTLVEKLSLERNRIHGDD
jgi:hypothetical protein